MPSGMWYIGSKSSKNCHPDIHEKYICSSKIVKPLILKNRKEWHFEILVIGSAQYIRNLETKFLKLLDARNDPMSFNQSNASCEYDRTGVKDSDSTRKKKSDSRKGNKNPMFGKIGDLSPHYGKKYSESHRKSQSIGVAAYAKSRPDSHNRAISAANKGNPNLGSKGNKNGSYGRPERSAHLNLIPPKVCEHCHRSFSIGNYTRYHGTKCKSQ
jgi:hypothetical protein